MSIVSILRDWKLHDSNAPKPYNHEAESAKFLTAVASVPQPIQPHQPTIPAKAVEMNMATFTSILSDIGNGIKKVFTVVLGIAQKAEPFVDLATATMPGIGQLYNTTVNAVIQAETAAIAAGQQNGTGAQKLALVTASIESSFNTYAAANGITTVSQATIEAYVNAVVASLNAIPAPAAIPAATKAA